METNFITIWIFSVVIGCLIGSAKGRFFSGLVWSLLFPVVGVLVVLCLPNLKKDAAAKLQLSQMNELLALQREQLNEIQRQRIPPRVAVVEKRYRVTRNGEHLGPYPASEIRFMIASKTLAPSDFYFDHDAQDWMTLDCFCG